MNWLITGGCGFIGSALVKDLIARRGHAVRVIDNLSVGNREDLAQASPFQEIPPQEVHSAQWAENACQLVVGDILNDSLAARVASGSEVIVHLAANTGVAPSVENPRSDCVTNVIGTLNYLEAARLTRARRFVFASSGAPVGECTPPIHEEVVPHPVSPYGASKLAGEAYCSAYFRTYGIETVALRFGNVYGPGCHHKSSVVAKFIRRALAGQPLEVYGDGDQTRDFIFVRDLTDAMWRAATVARVGGEVFQIASNRETTLLELLDVLVPALERRGVKGVTVRHEGRRPGDVLRNYSDTTKASNMLGWRAATTLGPGLNITLDDFLAQRRGS